MKQKRNTPKVNCRQIVLNSVPGTSTEIHDLSGVAKTTVVIYLDMLHESNEIFISRWIKPGTSNYYMPYYELGDQPDTSDMAMIPEKQLKKIILNSRVKKSAILACKKLLPIQIKVAEKPVAVKPSQECYESKKEAQLEAFYQVSIARERIAANKNADAMAKNPDPYATIFSRRRTTESQLCPSA